MLKSNVFMTYKELYLMPVKFMSGVIHMAIYFYMAHEDDVILVNYLIMSLAYHNSLNKR